MAHGKRILIVMGKSTIPQLQCTSGRVYGGTVLEKGVKEKGVTQAISL